MDLPWLLPFLLLLLLPPLRTQVTPDSASAAPTPESDNSTDTPGSAPSAPSAPGPSEGSASSSAPPPTEEDDWTPAETFLFTGDPSALGAGRCSRAYTWAEPSGTPPAGFGAPLRPALDALASSANFLNMIFQASDLRESTVREDMEWYHALVRALLEADAHIGQALLTFDADPSARAAPQLVLRAARDPDAKVQTIVLQDLSKAWDRLHPPAPAPDDSWFTGFKFPPPADRPAGAAALSKRVLLNDLSTLETPKWRRGDSYVTNRGGVRWGSAPFLDCQGGRFVPRWMLTLSTSFYGLKPDLTPEFRGVIRVDVDVQDIDVDQCSTGDSWFADTHQCNRTTMECVPVTGRGFRLGQYCCRCKDGFYDPELTLQDSDGRPVNRSAGADDDDDDDDGGGGGGVCYPNMPICLPCWPGCARCEDGAPCWVQEDWLLRAAVLAIQGVFMLLIFVSMLAAFRHRRNRRIRASGLLLLEIILFGSLLLYFPVFILYFKPSTFRCILLRWVRMLGFSIVYGTVTLKMYRVLKVFLSRTAQRVPYMSSLHLLRILGVMLMTVSWFLCAWTVGVLQNRDRNIPVFTTTATTEGQGFNLCYLDRWDYMMAVAELLFLCWGSSLWTAVRPVPSAFHEPRYMGIAIHNELLLSSMFHLFRFTFPSLHPDWMLLLSFTHTHVTITVTLALLFIPKFLHVSKPGREEIAAEVYEDEVDLRRSYLNSSFHSVWSEHSVDPEDFRDELKKLYAQLEVHKTKKMAANNPHLTKKRSSRCALGRSIIKRIAEIPESMSRQISREERDGSFRSRSINMSDSFRRPPDTVSISYRSSVKSPSPSPSMRKSQSDYHYVRDASPRGSILKSSKRASQRSHTDSLDIPPGVCKSASAQNLTIDANLLHPDHTRLHKSWSLTSNTAHSMENVSKVNRAATVVTRSGQNLSIGDQTRSALQSESFDKAEVCPWDVEPEVSGDRNQKHVTYANSEDNEVKRPPSPQALVCPWEFIPPVENTPSEDNGQQGEAESPKQQAPVSASAPGSPRPKFAKDQRVFSLRSATTKWLSVKTFMGSMDSTSRSSREGNLNNEDNVSQKSHESATTPRSGSSSRRPSMEKRTLQKRSMTTVEGKPHLVKQNAIRLSSGDSSDRSPRRLVIVKSAVHPWDTDEMQKEGMYENVFLSRQNSKRSSISSWETASSSRTPSTHRRGSYRITPVRNISHADVCPWEVSAPVQEAQGPQRQQSFKVDVCPWESQDHEGVQRQGSGRANVCPWESADVPVAPQATLSHRDSQRQLPIKPTVDICPWESTETAPPSKGQDTNICPWDVQDKAEVVYENLNPLETKGSLRVPTRQEGMKTAIYHGTSIEPESTEKQFQTKPPVHDLGKQLTKTAQSCPWEFPDPPEIVEVICPWDEGGPGPTNTDSTSQMTIKVDVCPWDSGDQGKLGDSVLKAGADGFNQTAGTEKTRGNVCPWETDPTAPVKTESQGPERPANVCPWETEGEISGQPETQKTPDNRLRQDTARENVCPWDTEGQISGQPETQKTPDSRLRQDTARENVCPWDTEGQISGQPETQKTPDNRPRQDTARENVCPWDTEVEISGQPVTQKTPDSRLRQDTARENVCPWDTEAAKPLRKQESSQADVCPWETGETDDTKVAKRQDSLREDVCPWETGEPKVLKKQDSSKADVCPWDTEEPKVLMRQDSSRADVCPWDTEEPKVLKKQDSSRADVCPWDTEEPKVLKKQSSSREDVCPWDTEAPKVLKKQASSREDVCPWDTEEPKVLKKQSSSREDVCPWDTEEPKVLKKQDSSRADVCPWDTEEPGSPINQDVPEVCLPDPGTTVAVDLAQSATEEASDNQGPQEHLATDAEVQQMEYNPNLALGRRDALCPWDLTRSRSGSFTDNTSDVFTWEPENIPEEDEEDDAEFAAEALVFPPDL